MKKLTKENVEVGLQILCSGHEDWGTFSIIEKDENWWVIAGRSGIKILFESEFRFWYTVEV